MPNHAHKNEKLAVVGVPWYTERAWMKMKEICIDKENFHSSYQLWLANADKSIVLMTNRNKPFEKLKIDPTSYDWWCENQALRRDKESRRSYIQYLLDNKVQQED